MSLEKFYPFKFITSKFNVFDSFPDIILLKERYLRTMLADFNQDFIFLLIFIFIHNNLVITAYVYSHYLWCPMSF